MINLDIQKIKPNNYLFVSFLVFTLLLGSLCIFLRDKTLFLSLESIKLILLSISIILPLFFINFLISTYLDEIEFDKWDKQNTIIACTLMGSWITSAILIFNIIFKIFYSDFNYKYAIWTIIFMEIIIICKIYYNWLRKSNIK